MIPGLNSSLFTQKKWRIYAGERRIILVLAVQSSGIGNKRIKRLLDVFKSPKTVFYAAAGSTARLYRSYTAKHRNDYEKQKYGKSL